MNIIRPVSKDDARIIAEAVAMAIGTASVVHYCGEDYMTALQEVALLEGTQYSYKCALIAEVDGQPAGALCGYDGALLESLRERTLEVIRKQNVASAYKETPVVRANFRGHFSFFG